VIESNYKLKAIILHHYDHLEHPAGGAVSAGNWPDFAVIWGIQDKKEFVLA